MSRLITVAACSLNQWALDYDGNLDRIARAVKLAKRKGAKIINVPELSVTGYGCSDHFLEGDLYLHSWETVAELISDELCTDILIDIGMPVNHKGVRYNCRVFIHNRNILLIRPKLWLANDGNYREMRYFTPWGRPRHVEDYYLPAVISDQVRQKKVPFGDAVIITEDTCIGTEMCEELWAPDSPHNHMGLDGVEIFLNSSGSHHQLRKLDERINLIKDATNKSGGIYLYSNQQGCDGDRLYYDGCALIIVNGEIVAQGSQFSLNEVEVITATVDIEDVRSYRYKPSRGMKAIQSPTYERVELRVSLSDEASRLDLEKIRPSPRIDARYHLLQEEIALGPACWLWDYLRRSKSTGYLVPLSGGIDSCATSVVVFSMCREVLKAVNEGNEAVIEDVRRIAGGEEDLSWLPSTPQDLCHKIFHTVYMGTTNSSLETRARAINLAKAIGAYHTDTNIDDLVSEQRDLLRRVTGFEPRFKAHGGSNVENLALQNIQARLRMVTAYYFAQMLPTVRQRRDDRGLLVLGSANVDESLRGYMTKYDCSSADINPIGGISKTDLKGFIAWAQTSFELPILQDFLNAIPSAELIPIEGGVIQSDEEEMGMTYDELSIFGRLRKVGKLGPWGMYEKLVPLWCAPIGSTPNGRSLTPVEVYKKVKRFFWYHMINRHKMTVLTPSYHAEQYSPDDNRFDLRPFLTPVSDSWWPFVKMQLCTEKWESRMNDNQHESDYESEHRGEHKSDHEGSHDGGHDGDHGLEHESDHEGDHDGKHDGDHEGEHEINPESNHENQHENQHEDKQA